MESTAWRAPHLHPDILIAALLEMSLGALVVSLCQNQPPRDVRRSRRAYQDTNPFPPMIQTVLESGLIIVGTKTSSLDFATSPVGEALTTRAKKKRVVKKDRNDMVMAIDVETLEY